LPRSLCYSINKMIFYWIRQFLSTFNWRAVLFPISDNL